MFYLMRHGKPDYSFISAKDSICRANLAPLLQEAKDKLYSENFDFLSNIDFIVSSHYTRALETAYIVSKKIDKTVTTELLLHEWLPDIYFKEDADYVFEANRLFKLNIPGKYEPIESCKKRLLCVFDKYTDKNILFVGHARLFSTVLDREINFAEIVEFDYKKYITANMIK